ncbi:MAG: PTS sugar transporter subunit IIB [Elusimicrobia bacterium]|nr:PTS sugar transporter subunit IIB [Elusimicrobiota bacterium]
MSEVYFRVDDRLIHGQVIEGWAHSLGLTRIIIASDRICNDETYRKLLIFSVPAEVKVEILSLKEAAEKMTEDYLNEEDTMVLFESPRDALDLIDYGIKITELNVGCMHYNGSNIKLKNNIAVTEDHINDFIEISLMGTKIECRALPQDKKVDLMNLIDAIE